MFSVISDFLHQISLNPSPKKNQIQTWLILKHFSSLETQYVTVL